MAIFEVATHHKRVSPPYSTLFRQRAPNGVVLATALLLGLEALEGGPSREPLIRIGALFLGALCFLWWGLPAGLGLGLGSLLMLNWLLDRSQWMSGTAIGMVTASFCLLLPRLRPKIATLGETMLLSVLLGQVLIASLTLVTQTRHAIAPSTHLMAISNLNSILLALAPIAPVSSGGEKKTEGRHGAPRIGLLLALLLALNAIGLASHRGDPPRVIWRTLLGELLMRPRVQILWYWLALLLTTLVVTLWYGRLVRRTPRSRGLQWVIDGRMIRKFYHLVAVALFLPALVLDAAFLRVGLCLAVQLFVFVESLRLFARGTRLADGLTVGMEVFRSGLDEGEAIYSHLWLLLGCAVPIGISGNEMAQLKAASGVLSLGVLDAFAALGGKLVGGPRWPASEKTIAGSIAGMASLWLAQLGFLVLGHGIALAELPVGRLALHSGICAGWEALSHQNDNLTLPLVSHMALSLLMPLGVGGDSLS